MAREKAINKVVEISVFSIVPNPAQPRRIMDSGELKSLSDSIAANGILQPLTVRKLKDGYELIAGERRLRAAKLAGITAVPCIIIDTNERQSAVFSMLENLQRKDLTFFEEALAYSALIKDWGITQEEASVKLGKAQSTIANKLRLLRLSEDEQQFITANSLTERHARALLRLENKEQRMQAMKLIAERGLNVTDAEQYIERLISGAAPKRQNRIVLVKDVRIFLNTVTKAVETMKRSGVAAQTKQIERDDCIEYIVTIPKHAAKQGAKFFAAV